MSDFFELDPVTGIRSDFKWNENDQEYKIIRTADAQPVLDFAAWARNEAGKNREGMKANWWLYAKIPPIVELQMLAKGINIHNPDHQSRMLAEINAEYPFLKCTTGHEGPKSSRQIYMPPDLSRKDATNGGVAHTGVHAGNVHD